jgi:hypothetical protein
MKRLKVAMSDLDDFLTQTLAGSEGRGSTPQRRSGTAHGDVVDPRAGDHAGALRSASGWEELSQLFRSMGAHFSDCTSYRFELVAAGVGGDLACTVGYEHT